MKKIKTSIIVLACFILTGCSNSDQASHTMSLKEALKDKFLIGAAINTGQASEKDAAGAAVVKQQFSSVTAENCMKSMYIQPSEGQFFFGDADRFVKFGVDNNMSIIGHTLVWHSQAPEWFFTDESGNDVSREVLIERMRAHITALVTRYKGKIKGWDVLNEAIEDDGSFRQSKFYRIIGEEYIRLAFQFANEADPGAELYYNDYSMAHEGKRQGVVNMVKSLQENGIRIDGIGMQGHFQMDFPSVTEFEKSLLAFAGLGVKVMITELDLTILPGPKQNVGAEISSTFEYQKEINPYTGHIPEDVQKAWDARYLDFFRLFLKHHDKIDRVTLWGVGDGNSWKNDWPVKGRTDYPLLFDRDYQPKPVVAEIIKEIKD